MSGDTYWPGSVSTYHAALDGERKTMIDRPIVDKFSQLFQQIALSPTLLFPSVNPTYFSTTAKDLRLYVEED
jgi:hypothetical protein